MNEEPDVLEPAHRHGVGEDDMLHAYENALYLVHDGEGLDMYIGVAHPGHPLLEIGVITWHGMLAINDAMPARARFLR